MSKIFTRTFRVRFAEVDANGWVGLAHYLRYLVETAYDWGEAGGFGAADSQALGLTWVIRETEFRFIRPLRHNDTFDFTIWMLDWKRVRGFRAYEIRLKENRELVAQGVQQLVSLDSASLHPAVPPESVMSYYRLEAPKQIPHHPFPKLPPALDSAHRFQRTVEWCDLDSLRHVNNAVFLTYAEEAAAQALQADGYPPDRLAAEGAAIAWRGAHIQYHAPAVWSERLEVTTFLTALSSSGGSRVVLIRRVDDNAPVADCLLDWSLADRASGEARPLPDPLAAALRQELAQTR